MTERSSHQRGPGKWDRAIQADIRALKNIDFELAYLALLTHEGLKPLSRWEKPLGEPGQAVLTRMGLHVERVTESPIGQGLDETIFGRSAAHLEIYAQTSQSGGG